MTEQLYQTDSYLKEFDAEVIGLNEEENAVLLNRTAFYPGGGGQPNDVGKFIIAGKELPVKAVKRTRAISTFAVRQCPALGHDAHAGFAIVHIQLFGQQVTVPGRVVAEADFPAMLT